VTNFNIKVGDSTTSENFFPEFINKVSLVVTSPPYHNAISYKSHSKNSKSNYRVRNELSYLNEYHNLLNKVWNSSWKLLKPGGYIAVNVGSVLEDGYHFALPQDIQSEILKSDNSWEFIRNITWNKVTAGVKRAGSVIQHALPGYWHPNIMTEHIIIFKKPGGEVNLNTDVPYEWWDPVWDLAPVPPRTINHPAPFPEEIPHRLIRMLTKENDVIFDPFNGAGSTTKAAFDLNRVGLGLDLEKKYVDLAIKRIKSNTSVRVNQLTIRPISAKDFVPGKSKGQTRHGAGINARGRDVK
jgi:site-specific DNA-methyltransferase (adenine-specific)